MRGDPHVEIGGIARAHGIRGEVAIVTHDPASTVLATAASVIVGGVERKLLAARNTQKGWLVQLDGVATRNDAEALRGQPVLVAREALGLDDDDILLDDLIGCRVVRADGQPWGEITAIDAGPGQDRIVIHDGDIERLLPLVDEYVTAIDLAAGVVTVDPPDGLPEERVVRKP
ncbi:MAG TPA: ribosome maturation factor RimM [Kofleriaceae bacterium]|nr:ribosome maturation factor RimM [Kofleriaceae bacterium]